MRKITTTYQKHADEKLRRQLEREKQEVVREPDNLPIYSWFYGQPPEGPPIGTSGPGPSLGHSTSENVARLRARQLSQDGKTCTVMRQDRGGNAYVTHFTNGKQAGVHGNKFAGFRRRRALQLLSRHPDGDKAVERVMGGR